MRINKALSTPRNTISCSQSDQSRKKSTFYPNAKTKESDKFDNYRSWHTKRMEMILLTFTASILLTLWLQSARRTNECEYVTINKRTTLKPFGWSIAFNPLDINWKLQSTRWIQLESVGKSIVYNYWPLIETVCTLLIFPISLSDPNVSIISWLEYSFKSILFQI